jgi:signal transduction histidine kinase
MTEEHGFEIPIDAHPDPVVAYVVESDAAQITATNDAFEATFDGFSANTRIGEGFVAFSVVRQSGDADPETHLVRGDAASIYLDGLGGSGPFLARIVPSGDDTGHLVFADLDSYPDAAETAGVGQVASVISHDLRNPLDVAKAHLRAARETGDAEHFDAVADAHDRMEQIIRDVLTLARGNEMLNVSDGVSIRTAAEDAWESVDTGGATLNVVGTLPTTSADPGRLRRLFENLFRNAVEHGSKSFQNASRSGDAVEHGSTGDRPTSSPR